MVKWKDCCYLKCLYINSIKSIFNKLSSHLSIFGLIPYTLCSFVVLIEGHRNGLVNLYKDMDYTSYVQNDSNSIINSSMYMHRQKDQSIFILDTIHKNGLVNLYKDMQSFGEYEDIRVM
ncbi:hypothetical protein CR513_28526, partial [Mucuna pruriens]